LHYENGTVIRKLNRRLNNAIGSLSKLTQCLYDARARPSSALRPAIWWLVSWFGWTST